ncbi:hypothetical protein FB451DRAFT_728731 [Mycena latifolia]|nr:hypothetical protein FB451DRAFT_728731 [Mycena latifolia]
MPNPGHIALVAGLVSSSYFALGNISNAFFGVMPITARGKTTLPVVARLALWNAYAEGGKLHMAGATMLSAVSLTVAAYTTSERTLRNFLAVGAAASYIIPTFTVIYVLPLNADLIGKLKSAAVKPMEPIEEQRVLDQLDKWRSLHRVRMVLGTAAWLISILALLATDKIIELDRN